MVNQTVSMVHNPTKGCFGAVPRMITFVGAVIRINVYQKGGESKRSAVEYSSISNGVSESSQLQLSHALSSMSSDIETRIRIVANWTGVTHERLSFQVYTHCVKMNEFKLGK